MPVKTRRGRGRPKSTSQSEDKLILKDIENEIDDPTIFEGVLAYKMLQKTYIDKPKEETMSLKDFEAAIDDFKKQKIYKETSTVAVNPVSDNTQTTPQEDNTTTEGGDG